VIARPLVALIAAGAALRFSTLGLQSYWGDEAVTATLLNQGLGHMLNDIPSSESTPPLYYVLAWLWTRVFGLGEPGLRSLSALAGTATIPVAYVLGARLASARTGLVAAALVAFNPLLWWYSQEARAYALVVLLTAAATAEFVAVLRDERRRQRGWALMSALALATHYFAVFVVAPQAAWLAWRAARPRSGPDNGQNLGFATGLRHRRLLAPLAVVVVTGLALLPLAIRQASNHRADFIERSGTLGFRLAQVPKQFLVGYDEPLELAAALVAGLAVLVALALLAARADRGERRGALLAAVIAGIAIAVPVLGSFAGADYLIARNLLPALVTLLAVPAIGLGARRAGPLGPIATAVICAASLAVVVAVMTTPSAQRNDWRDVARTLGPAERPRVIVLTPPDGSVALRWYLHGARRIATDTVAVGELDAVALGNRIAGQPPQPPRGPAPVPRGFAQVRRVERPTATIVVNTAPAPVPVDYLFANSNRLGAASAEVLYQPAARGGADARP
jgi:mannosyltransferase